MTVLVTGAAGFIGFHVAAALLRRSKNVIGVDSLTDYYSPSLKRHRVDALAAKGADFTFAQVDFADFDALQAALGGRTVTRIVHLGGQAGVRHSIDAPFDYGRANLVGQLNLLELARRHACPMVYASSSSVYGANTKLPFSVDDRVDHPVSLYAATKRAGELMAESYAHLYNVPLTGLRFFTVYGPWGRPDMAVWKFTHAVLTGLPVQLFNCGAMRRDFTYVDDVVDGVLAALYRPSAGHAVYNLGNDRPEELHRLLALIEAACGRQATIEMLPMQLGDVPATWADIDATRHDLGFAPRVDLATGIPRFVEWYRSYAGH